jgi:hypothetical protein
MKRKTSQTTFSEVDHDEFLLWWALDPTYGLVARHTGTTKAHARRKRKAIFAQRGWRVVSAKDLAAYQRYLAKGTHTLVDLV